MSLTMKTIMTALLLLLVIAQWNTASAQVTQGSLFSPPRSDQFGGYGRLRDGMFGEISYNYWMISKGKNQTVGWVADDPSLQNPYYTSIGLFQTRTNTMSTNSLSQGFHGGTTLRIGNMVKHHGWEIKSTIMQSQRDWYEGRNGSMDIKGDTVGNVRVSVVPTNPTNQIYVYDPTLHDLVPFTGVPLPYMEAGYFWGWTEFGPGVGHELAPMAITFEKYTLDSKISHWDVEANYIFRAHATRIGFFEFTGGVRYMQLDDSLSFNGWIPWRTTSSTTTGTGTGTGTGDDDATTTILDPPNSVWDIKAQNHIVGPQAGIRYIKKCSGRWSLIADTKFFAGFNTQNLKSEGEMGIRTLTYDPDTPGIPMGVPVGFAHNPGAFKHSETRNTFSPGIDFSLKANWRFTDSIAFNVGYQGIYLDRTARASLVNNYQVDYFGNLFGINEKVNQATWMHGVSFEVSINRF